MAGNNIFDSLKISNPARRAITANGITTLKMLSSYCEKDLLKMHGIGPSAITVLKSALRAAGLKFKKHK
jgi:predicted Fe-Mo cluster-binding NifX family protein